MAPTAVVHDHFVLLLETEEFEKLPEWLTKNFNIINGGTHAGGSSRNKLIVFKDGTYLELFNWIKSPVEFRDWANKRPGLIDFALTTLDPVTAEQNHQIVQNNISSIPPELDLGITYSPPLAGGRKRTDGTEVKWKNSRPSFQTTAATPDPKHFPNGRIDVPFFCHDVTDRAVRVPFNDQEVTSHPCGAVGIESVQVMVPGSHLDAYLAAYKALLDIGKPQWAMDEHHQQGAYYRIGVPHSGDGSPAYVVVSAARLGQTDSEAENEAPLASFEERGVGIQSLILRTAESAKCEQGTRSLAPDGIGRSIRLKG